MWKALTHGIWAFVKHYFFKLGCLDGWPGFVIAFGYFEVTFYRYAKAIEIQKSKQWQFPEPPITELGVIKVSNENGPPN